jgi:hypothetical protein
MPPTRLTDEECQRLYRPTTASGWKYLYLARRLNGSVCWRARVRRNGRLIQVASGRHLAEVARAVLRYIDEHRRNR